MKTLEINEENFKEFGSILKPDSRSCEKIDNFNYYFLNIINSAEGIEGGFLEVVEKIDIVKTFEKHELSEEVIVPLKGKALLYLAGKEKKSLREGDIKVFEILPGIGVRLNSGVWHAIPVLKSNEKFLCMIIKAKILIADVYFTELKS